MPLPDLVPVDHDPFDPLAASAGVSPLGTPRIDQINWGQPSWLEQAAALHGARNPNSLRPSGAEIDFATNMLAPGTIKAAGAANDLAKGIRAYHGSPYDFDKFDISKIGTGEGAQAYGHGLYFAENEGVAQAYADTLTKNAPWEGKPAYVIDNSTLGDGRVTVSGYTKYNPPGGGGTRVERYSPKGLQDEYGTADEAIADLKKQGKIPEKFSSWTDDMGHIHISSQPPRMYEVSISADPSHFLDWDKPLSEQHPKVQGLLESEVQKRQFAEQEKYPNLYSRNDILLDPKKGAYVPPPNPATGEGLYSWLANQVSGTSRQSDSVAANRLRDAGIPGIKYLDQGSRGAADNLAAMQRALENAKAKGDTGVVAHLEKQIEVAQKPTHNFVVFDDRLIDIIKKYGIAALMAGGAAHMATRQVEHDPFR